MECSWLFGPNTRLAALFTVGVFVVLVGNV